MPLMKSKKISLREEDYWLDPSGIEIYSFGFCLL